MIPKTFVITLQDTPDRELHIREQLCTSKIDGEIIHSINGYKLGLRPINPDIFSNPTKEIYATLGAVGNYLAHVNIWLMCQNRPENEFFIIEDDAIFVNNFTGQFTELYKKLPPDWDLVYVGWIPWGNEKESEVKITSGIVKKKVGATHAYLFKKRIIPILLESAYPLQSTIDLSLINKVWNKVNCYVFDPSLVGQKSYSNSNDTTWYSLVYNWKEDSFKFKNGIYDQIKLGGGWYKIEKNKTSVWRWTSRTFSICLPEKTTELYLAGSLEQNDKLTINTGEDVQVIELKGGNFSHNIKLNGKSEVKFVLENGFIPSSDGSSNDNRVLGVCIKEMKLKFKTIEIPINIELI